MSDVEVSRTESLTRQEAAARLSALAAALSEGGRVEIELGASTLKLHVPDHVECEVEVEVDGDEVELEVELTWSTSGPSKPKSPARAKPTRRTRTGTKAGTKAGRRPLRRPGARRRRPDPRQRAGRSSAELRPRHYPTTAVTRQGGCRATVPAAPSGRP